MCTGTARFEKAKKENVANQKVRSVWGSLPLSGTPRGLSPENLVRASSVPTTVPWGSVLTRDLRFDVRTQTLRLCVQFCPCTWFCWGAGGAQSPKQQPAHM